MAPMASIAAAAAAASEDEDESLANFLESEILSEVSDQEAEAEAEAKKRDRDRDGDRDAPPPSPIDASMEESCSDYQNQKKKPKKFIEIETGMLSKVPCELFHHILKFLSSEDLIACSLVCRFLNHAASDECLWHRLYSMRWGLASPTRKLRECSWKELYIKRDEEDMVQFVRNTPTEFKEYYIQMQVAKRSQAPLPSQVDDDRIILDKTVADRVSMWRVSRGLPEVVVADHACSGHTCSYYQIGNIFLCEKTGRVHVCGDTCREVVMDTFTGLWVCTVSGRCFDTVLFPAESETEAEQQGMEQQGTDEAEPFMGSGRFARAYVLGYDCVDDKELEAALRFC